MKKFNPKIYFLLLTVALLTSVRLAYANELEQPVYTFFSQSGVSLAELSAGSVGSGTIVYYLPERGLNQPSLVVFLSREGETQPAKAEVFMAPADENGTTILSYVPITISDNHVILREDISPSIIMLSPEGWWLRDEIINYNLDVQINGLIHATWGGELIPQAIKMNADTPLAEITVRDQNGDGLPDWDLRRLIPAFPGYDFLRTNYAERKCSTPLSIDLGVTPLWPFVAYSGGYEQTDGKLRPPIVVDWERSQIAFFSEIVTVRNQNCSYSFYSINSIEIGTLNQPNFETPFAFYDLSGKGQGFPNLILRTGRTVLQDDFSGEHMLVIRYSWSNKEVGDLAMDYKIDVLGFHPYNFYTPIADGETVIDAPSYELFPEWVVGKTWPIVTFIDTEDINYLTSEGIYEWAPGDLGSDFYLGYSDEGNMEILADIRTGMRGEYRLNSDWQSILYMSPIDNRLHLKWAEHGIWRLSEEQIVRFANLNNGEWINVWSREKLPLTINGLAQTEILPVVSEVIETIYALDRHLIHTDGSNLTLVASNYESAFFEMLPPIDNDTWERQRTLLASYEEQRRDPTNLHSWLDAFLGPRMEVAGASIANVRFLNDGFRFELTLKSDYQTSGEDLLGIDGLSAGDYLVMNKDNEFIVTPLVPATLSLNVQQLLGSEDNMAIQVSIHNEGTADANRLTLVTEALTENSTVEQLSRTPLNALAGETKQLLLDIPSSATVTVRLRLENTAGQTVAEVELAGLESRFFAPEAIFSLGQVPMLLPVLLLFASFLAGAGVLAISRRPEQSIK